MDNSTKVKQQGAAMCFTFGERERTSWKLLVASLKRSDDDDLKGWSYFSSLICNFHKPAAVGLYQVKKKSDRNRRQIILLAKHSSFKNQINNGCIHPLSVTVSYDHNTPDTKLESFPQIQNWGQLKKKRRRPWERGTSVRRRITTRWRHTTNSAENG